MCLFFQTGISIPNKLLFLPILIWQPLSQLLLLVKSCQDSRNGHDYTISTLDVLKDCEACADMGQL